MDYNSLIEKRYVGFVKEGGYKTTEIREGYARGELVLTEKHGNPIGSIHGGVFFTIADNTGGAAATSRGRFGTTVAGEIHYQRPAMDCKKLIGESREIKVGKSLCVYEIMITDESGTELAVATVTYQYLDKLVELD